MHRLLPLLAFALLVLLSTTVAYSYGRPRIEADLTDKASRVLAENGHDFAKVDVTARVVTLNGEAPSAAASLAAERSVEKVARGGFFSLSRGLAQQKAWGVRRVNNLLEIKKAPPPEEEAPVVKQACQVEADAQLALNRTVRFRWGLATLKQDSYPVLDRLARAATKCPTLPVVLIGTWGETAGEQSDLQLGKRRAATVSDYLIGAGVSRARIAPKGFDYAVVGDVAPKTPHLYAKLQLEVAEKTVEDTCQKVLNSLLAQRRIEFSSGSARIARSSYGLLNELFSSAQKCPAAKIRISGHTDDEGDDASNQSLSERRAESVRKYLIRKGMVQQRITSRGFGETRPVASNDTPEGRQRNRRIEIDIERAQ